MDKTGVPYIVRPLRVMPRASPIEERIAAVLHDVVEDTEWTPDELRREGLGSDILEALDALTTRDDEPYEEFWLRAARNASAPRVKLADLADHMELSRIAEPTARDMERW